MTDNLTTLLEKLRALDEKATPGPWKWGCEWKKDNHMPAYDGSMGCLEPGVLWYGMDGEEGIYCNNENDSKLLTEVRAALPLLLEIIEKQREALYKISDMDAIDLEMVASNFSDTVLKECDEIAARLK